MTTIRLAHSPDADDAFMFYALTQGKLDTQGIAFEEVRQDIETLNQAVAAGEPVPYDVSAVSFHAYPDFAAQYDLLDTGACFGEKYGPVLAGKKAFKPKQMKKVLTAIPGKKTTAFLLLKLYQPEVCYSVVPFDRVLETVEKGKTDAALIIHEGQLTYADQGLARIVDLGEWWHKQTGLPLPLGAVMIRKDLDAALKKQVGRLIQQSIEYALDHKDEALDYALAFARGLDRERASLFIDMYVTPRTVAMGKVGEKAVQTLFTMAHRAGHLKEAIDLDNHLIRIETSWARPEWKPVEAVKPAAKPKAAEEPAAAEPSTPAGPPAAAEPGSESH